MTLYFTKKKSKVIAPNTTLVEIGKIKEINWSCHYYEDFIKKRE